MIYRCVVCKRPMKKDAEVGPVCRKKLKEEDHLLLRKLKEIREFAGFDGQVIEPGIIQLQIPEAPDENPS